MSIEQPESEADYLAHRAAIEQKRRSFQLDKALLRYREHAESRVVYHRFLFEQVGAIGKNPDLAADPAIIEGNFSVKALCKYTHEGNFIIVRHRPVQKPKPHDYYVSRASLRNGDILRLYVTDHLNDGRQQTYLLSTSPDDREPQDIEPVQSGEPWKDILDEWDIRDMYADRLAEQPRIVLLNGPSYYREAGVRHDLFEGNIEQFENRLNTFESFFGELAVRQTTHVAEADMMTV